jgi:hypothetical protein
MLALKSKIILMTQTENLPYTELFIKMAITAWQTQNTRLDKLLNTFTNEQLLSEIAPGKNTGIYLVGHLAATNDALLPLFGLGDKLHPELEKLFLITPDKSGLAYPSVEELKKYWKEINETLTSHFNKFQAADWFARHTAVSEEDFAKEPHRNRLNVLLSRTTHQGYHIGQLILLKK